MAGGVHGGGGGMHGIRRDTVNGRAVRILLECILVFSCQTQIIGRIANGKISSFSKKHQGNNLARQLTFYNLTSITGAELIQVLFEGELVIREFIDPYF